MALHAVSVAFHTAPTALLNASIALHAASIALHAAPIALHAAPTALLHASIALHTAKSTARVVCAMISHVTQTDNAVCTEGAALACGFAFNGSAHSLKHFRHVQNHFQGILPSLDTLLGQSN